VCDCVLTRVAQIITATQTCSPPDLLINSDHKPRKLGQADLDYVVYRSF